MDASLFDLHATIEDSHWWFEGRRKIIYPLIDIIMSGVKDGMIVDVGCGTGGTIAPLATRYRTLGVDLAQPAIDAARRKYPNVPFRVGQIPDVLADVCDHINLLLLMDVLEHVPDDRKLLRELVELLHPNTHILITVPARMELWSPHDEAVGHLRRYDRKTLTVLFQNLPVTTRFLSYFNSRLYLPIRLVRQAARLLGHSVGSRNTDLKLPSRFLNNILMRIFASEASVIEELAQGSRTAGFSTGVSLIALLRRVEVRPCTN